MSTKAGDVQYQVFRLLTAGRTVSEIGAHLKLASNTVSTYRARILEKTGAKNDVELALWAERHAQGGPSSGAGRPTPPVL